MKVFFLRHQAEGVLHAYPFATRPTPEQCAPLLEACAQKWGAGHPKTGEPFGFWIVELEAIAEGELPKLPEPPRAAPSVQPFTVSAVAHVENPQQ